MKAGHLVAVVLVAGVALDNVADMAEVAEDILAEVAEAAQVLVVV